MSVRPTRWRSPKSTIRISGSAAGLGIAVVSESPGHLDRMLAAIARDLDRRTDIEVLDSRRSYLDEEAR